MIKYFTKVFVLFLALAGMIGNIVNLATHGPNGPETYHWAVHERVQRCARTCQETYKPFQRAIACVDSQGQDVKRELCNNLPLPSHETALLAPCLQTPTKCFDGTPTGGPRYHWVPYVSVVNCPTACTPLFHGLTDSIEKKHEVVKCWDEVNLKYVHLKWCDGVDPGGDRPAYTNYHGSLAKSFIDKIMDKVKNIRVHSVDSIANQARKILQLDDQYAEAQKETEEEAKHQVVDKNTLPLNPNITALPNNTVSDQDHIHVINPVDSEFQQSTGSNLNINSTDAHGQKIFDTPVEQDSGEYERYIEIDCPLVTCPEGCAVLYGYSIVYSIVFGIVFLVLAASFFLRRSTRDGFVKVSTSDESTSHPPSNSSSDVGSTDVTVSTHSLEIGARAIATALDHQPTQSIGCCQRIRLLTLWWRHVVLILLAFLLVGLTALSFMNILWLTTSTCLDFTVSAACNATITFITLFIYIIILLKRRGDIFNSNTLDPIEGYDKQTDSNSRASRRNAFETFGLLHVAEEEEDLEMELHLDEEDANLTNNEFTAQMRQVRKTSH